MKSWLSAALGLAMPGIGMPAADRPAEETPPVSVVALAATPVANPRYERLAPSSQLTLPEAQQLAAAFAWRAGRDIIVLPVAPTGSMRPYFNENALLLLEAAPFSELKIGDVVTFYHPTNKLLIVHRLVEKRRGVFWSRGDNNSCLDNIYVTPENYSRRLVGIIYMRPPSPAGSTPVAAQEARATATERSKAPPTRPPLAGQGSPGE